MQAGADVVIRGELYIAASLYYKMRLGDFASHGAFGFLFRARARLRRLEYELSRVQCSG